MNTKTLQLNVIHPEARIGKNVHVSPFVTIDKNVTIGDNSWIGPNVSILEHTYIGKNCKIYPGAVLGGVPQDLKFGGEESILEIAGNVIIREYCTLNRGTRANFKTYIGENSLIMAYVHIAHDCVIQNNCILANNVNLAGHIEIGEYAVLGGMAAVHQFVHIGKHSMIGGGSLVRKDVPPFVKAAREPLAFVGINSVGLKRRGFTRDQIHTIQDIYRILFIKGHNLKKSKEDIKTQIPDCPEKTIVMNFLDKSERGIMKGYRPKSPTNGFHS